MAGYSADCSKVLINSDNRLTPSDTDTSTDVFLWDATTHTHTLLTEEVGFEGYARSTTISADGSKVLIEAYGQLTADDQNGVNDVFLWDAATGTNTLLTHSVGAEGNYSSSP